MSEIKKLIVEELFRPARKNFNRRRTVIKSLDDLWQIDLAEFLEYSRENKGFKYVLLAIDCFSKFLYARKLKSKSATEVSKAMEDILKKGRVPNHIQSDMGKEFYNTKFKQVMLKYNINHYSTFSVKKAAICERVIRTIKEKIYKNFSIRGSHKWIDVLPEIISNYNSTVHRTTNMKPKDVNISNQDEILKKVYNSKFYSHTGRNEKYKIGDVVRISNEKSLFEKGYTPRWSTELFKVVKVQFTSPTTYLLEDMKGNIISGGFYEHEIHKTKYPETYLVEKVLKKKGQKLYIKWLGLPKSENSWVSTHDIK